MKSIFIYLALVFLCSLNLFSANYYFSSSSGDDNRSAAQAQNYQTPWKTIDKLNASMSLFLPGDSILFKKGDTFIGQIVLSRSGSSAARIAFSSYGTGSLPVIKGTLPITGWTRYNGNIWVAVCPGLDTVVTNFLINGIPQQIGRYPNANVSNQGYLTIESHSGQTSLSNSLLSSLPDLTGGEAVIRNTHWIINRIAIQSHSGNKLYLKSPTTFDMIDNYGFFIQNHLSTLDQNGEWCYDRTNRKIYLFHTSNPASMQTEATAYHILFKAVSRSYFSINYLEFNGSISSTLKITNSTDFEMKNSIFSAAGNDAINIIECNNINYCNNTIINSNSNALVFNHCKNVIINNNKILKTGLRAGMAFDYYYNYTGMYLAGNSIRCESNIIDSVGYIGIKYFGDTVLIKNNYIDHFCMTLDDGAAIYTAGSGDQNRILEKNIILNGIGAGAGTNTPEDGSAQGIYMDDRSDNVTITGNSVANCNGYGIYIHNANHFSILNNTVYNNKNQLAFIHDNIAPDYPITNGIIKNNTFFSKKEDQLTAYFSTIGNDISQFGMFDSNFYCRPINEDLSLRTEYTGNQGYVSTRINLKTWQNTFQYDLNSRICSYRLLPYAIVEYTGANEFSNSAFENNISEWTTWSNYSNGIISWDNSGKLDNGCLKLDFNGNSGNADGYMLGIGSFGESRDGENYILKFSMVSSQPNKKVAIAMQNGSYPYNKIASDQSIVVNTTRNNYELLFTPESSESNTNIQFVIDEDDALYWVDNIELYRATLQTVNIDDSIKFFYNAGNVQKTIYDGNYYMDSQGNLFHNFLLQPFSSLVLKKVTKEYYDNHTNKIKVESVSILSNNGLSTISATNGSLQLTAAIKPDDASDQSVTWSVINRTGKASVSSTGLVTAVENGYVTVKAAANDNSGIADTIIIYVSGQAVAVSSISINGEGDISYIDSPGGTLQLSATILPANATESSVSWSISSGTGLASINASGLLTAIADGIVTVTATATDGSGITGRINVSISDQTAKSPESETNVQTTYYIDPTNSKDKGQNGTKDHPYSSWSMVTWKKGNTYLQKKGTIAQESKINISDSCVTLGSYGEGYQPIIQSNVTDFAIRAFDKSSLVIKDLHIIAPEAVSCIYSIGELSDNLTIENCTFEGAVNGVRIMSGKDIVLRYNIFMNCSDAIYCYSENSMIYYNVFKENSTAINALGNLSSSEIYNNVFYGNNVGISNTYTQLTLYNNIFYMLGMSDIAIDNRLNSLISDNNIFYPEQSGFIRMADKTFSTLKQYQQDYNLDLNSFAADPRFVDVQNQDFSLEPYSPAIDAGKVVGLLKDFYGNAVPFGGLPDIGLNELANRTGSATALFDNQNKHIDDELLIYPNPCSGIVNINVKNNGSDLSVLRICDLAGKRLFERSLEAEDEITQTIDISYLPRGMYIFVVENKSRILSELIIIN